jgi:hypothetical protein
VFGAEASMDLTRRQERFCDGHFAAMIMTGHIAAILGRLGELANSCAE